MNIFTFEGNDESIPARHIHLYTGFVRTLNPGENIVFQNNNADSEVTLKVICNNCGAGKEEAMNK